MASQTSTEQVWETNTHQQSPQEAHLLDLLITLSTRKRFILRFTLGAAILTAVLVLVLPSQYTAETIVLPPRESPSLNTALQGAVGGASSLASLAGAGLGIKNPEDLYVSLFRLPTVEDAIIKRFGLMNRYHKKRMSDTRLAFEDHSDVGLTVKDGLIHISVKDSDPNLAAEIANAYVNEFRKRSATLAITEASQRRIFFQQQLQEANANLTTAEEAMKRTQQTTGVFQIDSQARSLVEVAATIRGQITAKEVQLRGMRSYATDDNPEVITIQQQLDALRSQLNKLSGTDSSSTSDIIPSRNNIPQAGMEYLNKLRDVRYYETIEELIAKQFEVAKLDEAREGAVIQVAEVAVPPDKRSFPKRQLMVIGATVLGFFVACTWCFLADKFDRLKNNPAERERMDVLRGAMKRKVF